MFEDLYRTAAGRVIARLLAAPFISKAAGRLLDSRPSRLFIAPFVRKNHIDLSLAEKSEFDSFNDFFCRRLKPGLRPVDMSEDALVSPCDGLLSVYEISPELRIKIKGGVYTPESLTQGAVPGNMFAGGSCLVFRLTPAHYHRYIYPAEGDITAEGRIPGIFHTVRPTALDNVEVFKTNTREYRLLESPIFGKILQMEIGATLVGRIHNHHGAGVHVLKGQEKGTFLFGGSTIVLLTELKLAPQAEEREVLAGERIYSLRRPPAGQ